MTPTQKRALTLLAVPGAEARGYTPGLRWRVVVGAEQIGTIRAETLLSLRVAGYVEMFNGGERPLDFRRRITELGRRAVDGGAA